MQVWFDSLARIVPEEEQVLHAFYSQCVQTPDWSAELGIELLSHLRATPRDEWNSIPQFTHLGRMVLSIVRLYVEKLNADELLAWQMIRVGDEAMRGAADAYDHDDGKQMSSVLSWAVRDAIVRELKR